MTVQRPQAVLRGSWTLPVLVFGVALAVRMLLVLRSGGFRGNYGYDSGVYYAAADALIHGRVPYRDFLLLHPPATMLALTPSAVLGRLTSDHVGFASANLGFTIIGALNAALVVLVARRMGLRSGSALAGGLFYALWFGSANAEFLARLEPLGNFFFLLGLVFLVSAEGQDGRSSVRGRRASRWSWWAMSGVALAVAASVKIWFVVPCVLIAGWVLLHRGLRPAATLVCGAIAGLLAVDAPFLVLSHGVMWSRVVTEQLRRPRDSIPLETRLTQLASVDRLTSHLTGGAASTGGVLLATCALFAFVQVRAWRIRAARLAVVLTLAHVSVLIAAPSWFGFYADFATVPMSITLAAAAATLPRWARVGAWLPVLGAGAISTAIVVTGSFHATSSWRGAGGLIAAVSRLRCVMSDAPNGLIELNVLDQDLANGCPNWVDVTARTYGGVDRGGRLRSLNAAWQRDLARYLLSGDAVFLVRLHGDGMTRATLRIVGHYGVLARNGPYRVYRTAHTPRPIAVR